MYLIKLKLRYLFPLCLVVFGCSSKEDEGSQRHANISKNHSGEELKEFLWKTIDVYNHASSFQCDGSLITHISSGSISRNEKKQVKIWFSRPHSLRIEWVDYESDRTKTNVLMANDSGAFLYLSSTLKPQIFDSLQKAINSTAGISSELSSFLPRLLLGETNSILFKEISDTKLIMINGEQMYNVTGTTFNKRHTDLVASLESHAICQITESFAIETGKPKNERDSHSPTQTDFSMIKVDRVVNYNNVIFNKSIKSSIFEHYVEK